MMVLTFWIQSLIFLYIPLSLQQMPHFFNHIMVREEQDISNWISPSKTLVLCKLFHERLPTNQHIQNKGLHICSMCMLCEKHEESIQHLFFKCSNSLHI